MKIDFAIMASDESHYLDFWPLVSEQWKLLGIEPVLLYFGKGRPTDKSVIVFEDKGYDLRIATCFARYWYAATLKEKVGIITDIDMIPLSKCYFVDQIETLNSYVHINPCIETYSRLPSCYHIATGNEYAKILELTDTFENDYKKLTSKVYNNKECFIGDNKYWCFDEFYATEMINKNENVLFLDRKGGQNGHRLDRENWHYDPKQEYYDIHSLRPFKEHEKKIIKIVELENKKNGFN
jgi:hypothetical protein